MHEVPKRIIVFMKDKWDSNQFAEAFNKWLEHLERASNFEASPDLLGNIDLERRLISSQELRNPFDPQLEIPFKDFLMSGLRKELGIGSAPRLRKDLFVHCNVGILPEWE